MELQATRNSSTKWVSTSETLGECSTAWLHYTPSIYPVPARNHGVGMQTRSSQPASTQAFWQPAQGRITTLKPAGNPSWPTLHLIVLSWIKSTSKRTHTKKISQTKQTNKSHHKGFYWLNGSTYTTGSWKVKEIKSNIPPVWIKETISRTTLKALK